MNFRPALVLLALLSTSAPACCDEPGPAGPSPEGRALAFLSREVPRWSRENHCFSCHNNGDAARALYAGDPMGLASSKEALADTTCWLTQPDRWDHNGGDGPFSDKRLARVQFSLGPRRRAPSGTCQGLAGRPFAPPRAAQPGSGSGRIMATRGRK